MKKIISGLLLLLCIAAQAQTDTELATDAKQMMGKYFPMGKNGFFFETYQIGLDTFLQKMDAYKTQAYLVLDRSSSERIKTLAKKDLDFYCRNLFINYSLYYGVDSVKQDNFYKLLDGGPGKLSPLAIDSANRAAHIKVFTPQQRKYADSLCYKTADFNDSSLFVYSATYRKYLSDYIQHLVYTDFRADFIARKEMTVIKLTAAQKNFSNAHIRDFYVYTYTGDIIKMSKDSLLKDSVYHDFMAHATNTAYRQQVEKIYHNYIAFGNNKPAPDFAYTSVDGKKVSLKGLRGKYVYIDVWATWCGPCKKEIPYLTEIEEAYQGKNIHFISLSVDVPADKEKWQQYVTTNHLKGIQLMADNAFDSEFIKNFNINSIPRFILVNPDGKIVSADAKRPSDPALKTLLDGLL
jgi:thiol-disulfide isomerase/thioredoxin